MGFEAACSRVERASQVRLIRTSLRFFGVRVAVFTTSDELEYLRFFYGDHLDPAGERSPADGNVRVLLWSPGGFFRSLLAKESSEKLLVVDDPPARTLERLFTHWSGVASPLPPFAAASLRERFAIARGATAVSPSGVPVLITGPNYVGKTALVWELLSSGWRLVSEHLLILDRSSGRVHRYLSPLGIRESRWHDISSRIGPGWMEHARLTVSTDTGRVALVGVRDVFPDRVGASTVRIQSVAILQDDDISGRGLRYELKAFAPPPAFPLEAGVSIAKWLPRAAWLITKPSDSPPRELAAVLSSCIGEEM